MSSVCLFNVSLQPTQRTLHENNSNLLDPTYSKRDIDTNNIAPPQQLLERNILRPRRKLLAKLILVMIYHTHPKDLRLSFQVAADPAHAQDSEGFALRVVAERG